ncbi:MAG: hypothetical protein IT454_19125 [Planctomycetes bacterium]|nr:hypothetical protein [Planctomycetota bacterium]
MSARIVLLSALTTCSFAALGHAQWTYTRLHPAAALSSVGERGDASQQVGSVSMAPGAEHAARWSGSASSWVDLHPTGFTSSRCTDIDGARQVGSVTTPSTEFAALWNGSAGTFVNLHPPGPATFSRVWGAGGGAQVGFIDKGNFNADACMWSGSAASFVNLAPPGSTFSVARDAAGGQQVGQVHFGGVVHAAIWAGSAASFVDIHPTSGFNITQAIGTDGVQQVGRGVNTAAQTRACLWSGSASSFVDLTPVVASSAEALAVDSGVQVGWFNFPFQAQHACLWRGNAASMVNLHDALPSNYSYSIATSVWQAGGRTWVLGSARNPLTGQNEAVLWWSLKYETYCTGKLNSLGCTPAISSTGFAASATSSSFFFLRATALRNQTSGLLFYGAAGRASAPFAGGTMCVASPRLRGVTLQSGGSNSPAVDCSGVFTMDLHGFRSGALGGSPAAFLALPGTLVDFQFWGRDPGFTPPNNVQLSNALEIEIGP